MAMSPAMQAKLDALKNAGTPPADTTDTDTATGDAPEERAPAAKPAPRARAPKAKAAPAGSLGATMAELCTELASAELAVADAVAAVDAVKARMVEALA